MFVQKALFAQEAGARGLIVVSDTEVAPIMDAGNDTRVDEVQIFVLAVGSEYGNEIIQWNAEHKDDLVIGTFQRYYLRILDLSELIIIMLATALVVAGAFFATSDLRRGSPLSVPAQEVL